jgi:hypothetical protein
MVERSAMQDKTYVIAMFVILAICCLGMYVAVSGYLNSNPGAFPDIVAGIQGTPVVISISTYTPAPTQPLVAVPNTPTIPPVPSPLGAFQTITAAATIVIPTPAPTRAVSLPTATSASGLPSCAGFAFCPRGGEPDLALGFGGEACPRNSIIGRVVGLDGRGLRERTIRFINPLGQTSSTTTKGPPDPEGKYDIPSVAIGSTWTIWLLDTSGAEVSPRVKLIAQPYTGVGNCPTRLDFVQQR